MSFGSRLKERREAVNLTQKDLGVLLGVSGNAVGNYEKGISSPNADALYKVFDILQCDANYLFQDEMKSLSEESATPDEMEFIKKYRALDGHGKDMVDTVLEKELARVKAKGPTNWQMTIEAMEAEYKKSYVSARSTASSASNTTDDTQAGETA